MTTSKFVLHKHDAFRAGPHYDLRIEVPGQNYLNSWAIPKAEIPSKTGQKLLAILGEPHPKEWISFQGDIPKGEYGGGKVTTVDKGTVQIIKWTDDSIKFSANSKMLKGTFVLVRFKTAGKNNNWLFMKSSD
jgi:bifunctional non-homologous end joining protein LigD